MGPHAIQEEALKQSAVLPLAERTAEIPKKKRKQLGF
jgi:hypothetical protein